MAGPTGPFRDLLANAAAGAIDAISLHSADPGTTGASEVARVTQASLYGASSAGTIDLAGDVEFAIEAGEAPSFWGIWDGATFLGGVALTAAEGDFEGDRFVTGVAGWDAPTSDEPPVDPPAAPDPPVDPPDPEPTAEPSPPVDPPVTPPVVPSIPPLEPEPAPVCLAQLVRFPAGDVGWAPCPAA